jgi:hypothetical protein
MLESLIKEFLFPKNLTKVNQPIFAAAMRLKRERKIASVSTSNGTVHVKLRQGDRRVPIQKMAELECCCD